MSGTNGGKRPGAGRKKGSGNKKTAEIARRAAEEGITPLEVLLNVMRDAYKNKEMSIACDMASRAAPYIHPKLAAIEMSGADGGPVQLQIVEEIVEAAVEPEPEISDASPSKDG